MIGFVTKFTKWFEYYGNDGNCRHSLGDNDFALGPCTVHRESKFFEHIKKHEWVTKITSKVYIQKKKALPFGFLMLWSDWFFCVFHGIENTKIRPGWTFFHNFYAH